MQVQEAVTKPNLVQIPINIPLPSKLELTGDFDKLEEIPPWLELRNSSTSKDPGNPAVNKSLRTATLLTCIDSDALDLYKGLEFENENDKKDIDIVLHKQQHYCIGETKSTRDRFNNRDQEPNDDDDDDDTFISVKAVIAVYNH